MTFFGEEKGLLGSRYYGRHPVVPIKKTVADVNLEQVGRTDDSEGPRVGAAVMTGHGYSDVSDVFTAAGEAEGVKVYRHPRFSDSFFGRSDNQALADLGVPAHTIVRRLHVPRLPRRRPTTGTRSTTPTWPRSTAWSPAAC